MKKLLLILKQILIYPFIFGIKIYQLIISPILPSSCRFNPTCSQYSIEAFKEWGLFRGFYLSVKRILRCHPWGGFGEDPIPKKKN